MVTNYYNASNNFSAPIRREPKPFAPRQEYGREEKREQPDTKVPAGETKEQAIDKDTLLLLGLILLLFMSGCEDTLLLFALGYLILF